MGHAPGCGRVRCQGLDPVPSEGNGTAAQRSLSARPGIAVPISPHGVRRSTRAQFTYARLKLSVVSLKNALCSIRVDERLALAKFRQMLASIAGDFGPP